MDNTYDNMSDTEIMNVINNLEIVILSTINNGIPNSVPVYYDIKRKDNDIVIVIKSKNRSQKIISMMKNSNVALFFYHHTPEEINTIIATGNAYIRGITNEVATIEVLVRSLSGRKYYN